MQAVQGSMFDALVIRAGLGETCEKFPEDVKAAFELAMKSCESFSNLAVGMQVPGGSTYPAEQVSHG